jgi:glycosyltransferase involved in cell wall biosynthesis
MKIFLINKFLYPKGGDAISTITTGRLLTLEGHRIVFWGMEHFLNSKYPYSNLFVSYVNYNNPGSLKEQIRIVGNILYSFEAKRKIEGLIKIEKPDIVHLNNFAHQISPSILHIFRKYKIPVIMTMHDYKMVCASYSMLNNGNICELCKGERYYNCFFKSCVKRSKAKSLLNTIEMYLHHKILHIYELIDAFISPSRFLKSKLAEMGFKEKIVYLPNFVEVKDFEPQYDWRDNSIIYFGRLSKEKGLFALIDAVKDLDVRLNLVGDGPIKEDLKLKIRSEGIDNVYFLGHKKGKDLKNEIRKSVFVVVPSEWYENNPRSIIESFALGKPAVASRIGGIPELVKDNETGLTFEPRNAEDLRSKIKYLIDNPDKIVEMGKNARAFVEKELNAEKHYQRLMEIYNEVITERKRI